MTTVVDSLPDEQIQRHVAQEMQWDARLQPNEIGVIVEDGVVTLTGWVDNYLKKRAAEQAALRVAGVVAVANDIEVRLAPSAERTDSEIAAAAAEAIERDPFLPKNRIQLSVSNGWVTLRGDVDLSFQRQDAERDVAGIRGVRGITNLINVSSEQTVSATDLKEQIEKAMLRSAEVDARNVTVQVQRDKVVLDGQVHSWAERRAAERAARAAPGVKEVENRIKVRFFGD